MGRLHSLGLERVLERMVLTAAGARRKILPAGDAADGSLPTGQRRILEHVAMMSVDKRLQCSAPRFGYGAARFWRGWRGRILR